MHSTRLPESESSEGVECCICCESFALRDAVPCESETGPTHWFCRPCVRSYVTVTVASSSGAAPSSVTCPSEKCRALLATANVAAVLSRWERSALEERCDERDANVALRCGAVAALQCKCGAVGVVLPGDEPASGCVQKAGV